MNIIIFILFGVDHGNDARFLKHTKNDPLLLMNKRSSLSYNVTDFNEDSANRYKLQLDGTEALDYIDTEQYLTKSSNLSSLKQNEHHDVSNIPTVNS